MDKNRSPLGKYNVANRLEKRSLLIAINLVAGVSIFFFGYDQGVMGGVNQARNYAETMGFGHWSDTEGVIVDRTLLQGGIVRQSTIQEVKSLVDPNYRTLSTICLALWSAA